MQVARDIFRRTPAVQDQRVHVRFAERIEFAHPSLYLLMKIGRCLQARGMSQRRGAAGNCRRVGREANEQIGFIEPPEEQHAPAGDQL